MEVGEEVGVNDGSGVNVLVGGSGVNVAVGGGVGDAFVGEACVGRCSSRPASVGAI